MGWLQFRAWVDELNRQRSPQHDDPDSWAGRANDPFWQKVDARRRGEIPA